jgi:hypothetical protein
MAKLKKDFSTNYNLAKNELANLWTTYQPISSPNRSSDYSYKEEILAFIRVSV